jgi:hypothetical protein
MSAGDDKRSAWSFVAGMIAGSVLIAFVGGNGSSDPRQVLSDDKAWPPELPSDQDEALLRSLPCQRRHQAILRRTAGGDPCAPSRAADRLKTLT